MSERFKAGWKKMQQIGGKQSEDTIELLENLAPGFGKHIVEYAFGDIFCRDGLDLKQRELVLIASLTTQGDCNSWLHLHINAGLNAGLKPKEIVEAIVQCSLPCGLPRILNSLNIVDQVFKERKIHPFD
ncbi:carboxymuconolactone decarboxylase family protein [Sporolactobacillus pectinivorans]|uniref:carboxymuconolactone decarboxylase family protein n=1 Tax=Sporolactobacillus pectinivorans TaxID=1591408 RepID=UPI000C2641FA|nr:carboxymuconolactone decarboxylase family protein [Sporolactobacillus pectinivorans]